MAGRPQKSSRLLQDQRPERMRTETELVDGRPMARIAPPPPAGVLKATKERWALFWTSPVAAMVRPSDMAALHRWALLVDEQDRAMKGYRHSRVVPGSRGQIRRSPMFDVAMALAVEIRQLEDRFGMNPLGRMRLGLALVDQQSALDKLNDRLNGEGDEVEWSD